MSLVQFTRPDGQPCLIKPDNVDEVTPAPAGVYHPKAKTVIVEDGITQVVIEPFDEVRAKLGV